MSSRARALPSGPHSVVWALETPGLPGIVVKRCDVGSARREAAALAQTAHLELAPELLCAGAGVLVLALAPGTTRPLARASGSELTALGRAVRRVHDSRRTATGRWPDWRSPARSLTAYRARVAAEASGWALGAGRRELAAAVVARLPPLPAEAGRAPFARLHGDLWSENVLWQDDGRVRLVDWEYSRQGDPAEELAYLAELDGLDDAALDALLAGYGADAPRARVAAWRPLCALMAGLWFAARGLDRQAGPLLARAAARS
jgi:aminoglycoside phosphotransferase (APT) family kinase protein